MKYLLTIPKPQFTSPPDVVEVISSSYYKLKIISKNTDLFKVYSLEDKNGILVSFQPYLSQNTETVDGIDLANGFIIKNEDIEKFLLNIENIINLYNSDYKFGQGYFYDFVLFNQNEENNKLLFRIQLIIEDKVDKKPLKTIVFYMNGYINKIDISSLINLRNTINNYIGKQ